MSYEADIAQGLAEELMAGINKYDESLLVPTVVGCLEIVKAQIILDAVEQEDDEDDE